MSEVKSDARSSLPASLVALRRSKDNINIRNVRSCHLKYMLIFPLAPVFANMQGALFSESVQLFTLDAMTLMGSAYCIGAGVLFAFTRTRNMAFFARLTALVTAAAFAVWLLMPESLFSLIMALVFTFGLGGCAACAAFAYTFILNNAERLLGAAAISLFFALSQLDAGLSLLSGYFGRIYLAALILGTAICLSLYKKEDFIAVEARPRASMNPAIKLTLYFFVAHYFVEIFYTYLPGSSSAAAQVANGSVGIFVVFLAVTLQLVTRRSVWNMCNIFFIAMLLTYGLYFMPEGSALRSLARYIHGFEQMGYIAAYYLLGCVFKKHGDFRLFKLCLVIILPVSMLSYLIPGAISAYTPDSLPLAATLTTAAVFIGFILLSPAYSKHLFAADWSDAFRSVDMTEAVRKVEESDLLEDLKLTPREKEVAALLLLGKDAKQISTDLTISVHTANFHIKNLYRKLGINKRSELFAHLYPESFPTEN